MPEEVNEEEDNSTKVRRVNGRELERHEFKEATLYMPHHGSYRSMMTI